MKKYKVVSLFSGCGGLDLGFKKAGFNLIWANEFDKTIIPTHKINFPNTYLDDRSIADIKSNEVPDIDGIIGGPPCQSWSEAGARRGIKDSRGKLFYEYIRILKDKQPLFFLAENVSGILHKTHSIAFNNILEEFNTAGYNINYDLLNAVDFNVPQDRKRVFIVGIRKDLDFTFNFPEKIKTKLTLKDAIYDLKDCDNHEYMSGGFSSIFMSRNRVRNWHEPSFTIQAGGRHAPIHPSAPKMAKIDKDKFIFISGKEHLYRRLSVRECARIQTFPDNFIFKYNSIANGYKMVGNAVPVELAYYLAVSIKKQIEGKING